MTTASRLVARRISIVTASVLLFAVVGFFAADLRASQYTASAALIFRGHTFGETLLDGTSSSTVTVPSPAATERTIESQAIAAATARSLSAGSSTAEIAGKIEVEGNPSTEAITVSASDEEPERAATIANTYAEQAVRFYSSLARQRVAAKIRALQRSPAAKGGSLTPANRRSLSRLRAMKVLQVGSLEVAQKAVVPADPSSPQPLTVALLSALVGLVGGLIGAIFFTWNRAEALQPEAIV